MQEETNEGIAYLKALKDSTVPATAAGAGAAPAPEPIPAERFQGAEKRRSPRHRCAGSVELRDESFDVRTWATFTDISLHGCYVEAQATYPVGTVVRMKLEVNGVRLETKGEVRVNYPYLGMGIAFLEMSEENRERLKDVLGTLSRSTVLIGSPIDLASEQRQNATDAISDPFAVVRALIEYFEHRQILMRDDFLKIVRKFESKS